MSSKDPNLKAAKGYLDLGMFEDALEEIAKASSEMRGSMMALALRVDIYDRQRRWDLMEAVAWEVHHRQPNDPDNFLPLARAIEQGRSRREAMLVLTEAVRRFSEHARLLYNLACLEAQEGELSSARLHLDEALRLEPDYAEEAITEPDLVPLRSSE